MKIVAKVTEGYFMESLVPERCATKKQPKQDVRKISFQKQFKSIFKKKSNKSGSKSSQNSNLLQVCGKKMQ